MVLFRDGDHWSEPEAEGYTDELDLQALLAEHPSLLPGIEGSVAVATEYQSGAGPTDIVVLASDGTLTLVECKLAANPEVRRKVVGQLLDYASKFWRMSVEEFETQWIRRTNASPFDLLDDEDGSTRAAVAGALEDGRFRLVLAVDSINDDLRRIVEFLNHITLPATGVMALELQRSSHKGTDVLMPKTYGAELVEEKESRDPKRRQWTADQYLDWIRANDPKGAAAAEHFIAGLRRIGFDEYGGRAATPSYHWSAQIGGRRRYPVLLFTHPDRGASARFELSEYAKSPNMAEGLLGAISAASQLESEVPGMRESGYARKPKAFFAEMTEQEADEICNRLADWVASTNRATT